MEKIGLIAGNRKFPILFAQAAKRKGHPIVAVAVERDTSPGLKKFVDKIYWVKLKNFSKAFDILKEENVAKVVMAGQISPHRLFSREVRNSPEIKALLESIVDKRADTIFGAIAQRLESAGLQLLDSTLFMQEYMPGKATLTENEPDFNHWEDIYFGFDLAKEVGYLDIGQTVAVKNKAIVAVEALEGTDNLIRRAGRLARAGIVLVKVSKPKQDMRFDIPVVGLNTVKNLIKVKAACLAMEAGKTLFIDQEASVKLANKKGLAIVAI
jgi:DUF1009 family protein